MVEVSGRKGHASDAERARDAQRRNELQDIGRKVYEYTYQQVIDATRTYVLAAPARRLAWSRVLREAHRQAGDQSGQ